MVTGRRAFEGTSQASLIAAILEHQPPAPSTLQKLTPPALDQVVGTCLAKDPDERWQSAGDLVRQLRWIGEHDAAGGATAEASGSRARGRLTWGGVGVVVGVLGPALVSWGSGRARSQSAPAGQVVRSLVDVAPAEWLQARVADPTALSQGWPSRTVMALSPDGHTLAFSAARAGVQQLYLRQLNEIEAKPIAGTERANSPFFSPDGEWIGFHVFDAPGVCSLWKVPGRGSGPPVKLCDIPVIVGATWGSDGTIIVASVGGGLRRLSANGGSPEPLTQVDAAKGEFSHRLPSMLPGKQAVLFTVTESVVPNWSATAIAVQSLMTGERKTLIQGGADGRYVPTGHLVFMRSGTLMAVPFDLERLEVTGGPIALAADVMQTTHVRDFSANQGSGQFSVSATGRLVYLAGGVFPALQRSLVWVDRSGAEQPLTLPHQDDGRAGDDRVDLSSRCTASPV